MYGKMASSYTESRNKINAAFMLKTILVSLHRSENN
jgi:hypothetical protein